MTTDLVNLHVYCHDMYWLTANQPAQAGVQVHRVDRADGTMARLAFLDPPVTEIFDLSSASVCKTVIHVLG